MNTDHNAKVMKQLADLYDQRGANTVFMPHVCGGLGVLSFNQLRDAWEAYGRPFPMCSISYDTDSSTKPNTDIHVQLKITPKQLRTINANAEKLHPQLRIIVDCLKEANSFTAHGITKGSRSVRMITQLAILANLGDIVKAERQLFDLICTRYEVQEIIPVYISSTGGGCGGSAVCNLLSLYGDPAFGDDVFLTADEDLIQPAICIFAEPFAYARTVKRNQRHRILSNSMAVRLETDEISSKSDSIQYCFHIGYSNRASVSLVNDRITAQVIGRSAFDYLLNYPAIKALFVNDADFQAHVPYGGKDTLSMNYSEMVDNSDLINNGHTQ